MVSKNDLRYRPICIIGYLLSELATLILRKKSHEKAQDTLHRIRNSPAVTILHLDETQFGEACDKFARYDDQ